MNKLSMYSITGAAILLLAVLMAGCGSDGTVISSVNTPVPTPSVNSRLDLVFVQGGTYQMGSDGGSGQQKMNHHQVTVNSFHMGKYEMTNEEFCLFLNNMGNQTEGGVPWMNIVDDEFCGIRETSPGMFEVKPGYENRPAVNVSWHGAAAYCNWLSEEEGLEQCYGPFGNRGNGDVTRNGYRLPTEGEWEYACRGGTDTEYYWGMNMDGSYCWYGDNSQGNHHEVGQKQGNSLGLCDMSGNVNEWCNDWHGEYSGGPEHNPTGPANGENKVFRGGSWKGNALSCQSGNRGQNMPGTESNDMGFRPVRSAL